MKGKTWTIMSKFVLTSKMSKNFSGGCAPGPLPQLDRHACAYLTRALRSNKRLKFISSPQKFDAGSIPGLHHWHEQTALWKIFQFQVYSLFLAKNRANKSFKLSQVIIHSFGLWTLVWGFEALINKMMKNIVDQNFKLILSQNWCSSNFCDGKSTRDKICWIINFWFKANVLSKLVQIQSKYIVPIKI